MPDRLDARTTRDAFATEMADVFSTSWIAVGIAGELSAVGDYRVRDVGDQSVIVVRDSHELRVNVNVCTHERLPILGRHAAGNAPVLVCPFHSWSFTHDGRYRPPSTPPTSSAARSERDLTALDVVVNDGVVWARRLAPAVPTEPPKLPASFGRPSPPHRLAVAEDWTHLASRMRQLIGTVSLPPNSGLCRPPGGADERALVTIVPRAAGRSEIVAWTDLSTSADPVGRSPTARRRALVALIAHGARGGTDCRECGPLRHNGPA